MIDETTNRFNRIVAILTQLQSTRVLKAQDLADRFNVSLRTIYRDIRSLEAAGVPVSGEAGVGYSIMDGYRLPPVMFSREEASSFVAAGKLMQQLTDRKVREHYESAMLKIRSVLRTNLKDHMDLLQGQVWVEQPDQLFEDKRPDSLATLFESIASQRQVMLLYQSYESEQPSQRNVEPVGVLHEGGSWYLIAFCHLRNDYRNFRTDRIQEISRLDASFTREHPPVADFREKTAPGTGTPVVIRVDKDVMKYLRTGKKYFGVVSEKLIGKQVEMTFLINDEGEGLARWYMSFGDHGEIVSPESFREKVSEMAKKIIAS